MGAYMILVTGGSGSGKSAFAEKRVLQSGLSARYYLATMQPGGSETDEKIRAHRARRQGQGWITIEQPADIVRAAGRIREPDSALLLEDLSNLLANEMFREGSAGFAERIEQGIGALLDKVSLLVVVTNSIFDDGIAYDAGTQKYLRALADLNARLAKRADEVWESVVGIPVRLR